MILFTACGGGGDGNVSDIPTTHALGGTVSGLIGGGLVFQNNGQDNLTIESDGSFVFPSEIHDNDAYDISVHTTPGLPNQHCSVSQGKGNISGSNIDNVQVNCEIKMRGSLSGPVPKKVVMQGSLGWQPGRTYVTTRYVIKFE